EAEVHLRLAPGARGHHMGEDAQRDPDLRVVAAGVHRTGGRIGIRMGGGDDRIQLRDHGDAAAARVLGRRRGQRHLHPGGREALDRRAVPVPLQELLDETGGVMLVIPELRMLPELGDEVADLGEEAFEGHGGRNSRNVGGLARAIRAAGSAGRVRREDSTSGAHRAGSAPAGPRAGPEPLGARQSYSSCSSSGSSAAPVTDTLTTPGSSTIAGTRSATGKRPWNRMSITTSFWSSSSRRWLFSIELVNPDEVATERMSRNTPAPSVQVLRASRFR